ncbi:MAG: PLP-dependent transferase [Sulfurovum sp.]|jgi:cystathionine gamma-synthase
MNDSVFKPITCGQTLPQNNIHAVSVSMPKLQDVIDYEEQTPQILEKIKSAYPRFVMHPYLKILAQHIKVKYQVPDYFEVVLLSSKKAVDVVAHKYYIYNKIPYFDENINEPFGVILVRKNSRQLKKVLQFIQHVGYNLSSRLAEDYLFDIGLLDSKQDENLYEKNDAKDVVINSLAKAYNQPSSNVSLAPSGMNAVYSAIKGAKSIGAKNGRTIIIQLGWLYLDTMNIVDHYYERIKKFLDVKNLNILEEYLQTHGFQVSSIITEIPTNPLLACTDLPRLRELCDKYNIALIIDSTFATPYICDLLPYGDIFVESLTKFASGNADVLMGTVILNKNSKISHISEEFFKHPDTPYIKDIQRLALEIQDYEARIKTISSNTEKLVQYLQTSPIIDKIYSCQSKENQENFLKIAKNHDDYVGVISITFTKDFQKIYDEFNFAKGPSLGTEFTLLMPYTYLAHYDYLQTQEGREFLNKIGLPKDLLRISVGTENIEDIINEFKRVETLVKF